MSKNKGFDVVADAQERAEHNMNPYYWFNRITPYTMAQWNTNKYFAPLFFIIYSATLFVIFRDLNESALEQHKTFWAFLFDFSDSSTSARFAGILLLTVFWLMTGIGAFEPIVQRIFTPPPPASEPEHKREKKKKYPKRPKNYK